MENFEVLSLENHLFFARIMKEHALFLEAGFPCKNADHIRRAERFKIGFEGILSQAAEMGNGIVSGKILRSGELFTDYTLDAEEQTAYLTGIMINGRITRLERQMTSGCGRISCGLSAQVEWLNERALRLLDGLIAFKEEILEEVERCRLYTASYPLLIRHITREARLYRCLIRKLQGAGDGWCCELQAYEKNGCCEIQSCEKNGCCEIQSCEKNGCCEIQSCEKGGCCEIQSCEKNGCCEIQSCEKDGCCEMQSCEKNGCGDIPAEEIFWNQIMMEHALFIRGLLDPSEEQLICAADGFAQDYKKLLAEARKAECTTEQLIGQAHQKTGEFRDFKAAGAKGIAECQVKSLILPLLADHVLREANHYLRLLEMNRFLQ